MAVGTVALITASLRGLLSPSPQTASLSLPLVVIFFMAFGFRAAFNIPTELSANWAFRVFPPPVEETAAAARLLVMTFVVVPVAVPHGRRDQHCRLELGPGVVGWDL